MENLKKASFKIPKEGVIVKLLLSGKRSKVLPNSVEYEMEYYTNNGWLVFVTEGETYVTRIKGNEIKVLEDNGFEKRPMPVPFSNGEIIDLRFAADLAVV